MKEFVVFLFLYAVFTSVSVVGTSKSARKMGVPAHTAVLYAIIVECRMLLVLVGFTLIYWLYDTIGHEYAIVPIVLSWMWAEVWYLIFRTTERRLASFRTQQMDRMS